MREVRWVNGVWLQRLLLLCLLVLAGGALGAQEIGSPNWSGPLTDLRKTLQQLKQHSLMQERLINELSNDNGELRTLLTAQQRDYQTLAETLDLSQNSLKQVSSSWTNYLQLSEEEIRQAWARVRRNRLAWQIGIPLALLTGYTLGRVVP